MDAVGADMTDEAINSAEMETKPADMNDEPIMPSQDKVSEFPKNTKDSKHPIPPELHIFRRADTVCLRLERYSRDGLVTNSGRRVSVAPCPYISFFIDNLYKSL